MREIGMKLREAFRKEGESTGKAIFREALKTKKIDPRAISIRGLADGMIGENCGEVLEKWKYPEYRMNFREQSVTDASGFMAVTGQILIDMVREQYELEVQSVDKFFRVVPCGHNLQTYREQIVSRVTDIPGIVNQAMPYPNTTFGQLYVDYPAPSKFGEQCNVTAELVIADQTAQIYKMAASVGEMTGYYEAGQKLRVLLGITNNFSMNGTASNTYRTSGSYVNDINTFSMTNWRGMNTLMQVMMNQTDPATGLPIKNDIRDIFVIPTRVFDMKRIFGATEVQSGTANTSDDRLISSNPLAGETPNIWTSRYAQNLLINELGFTLQQATNLVIAGNFLKAFVWRQVWPVTVTQLPPGSEREFDRDIILSVKASGFGVAGIADPRYVVRGYS